MKTLHIKYINQFPGPAFFFAWEHHRHIDSETSISSTIFLWQPGEFGLGQGGLGFESGI